jgi:hypothetical protein
VGAQGAESPPDLAPCATIKNECRQEKGTTGSTSWLRDCLGFDSGAQMKPFGPEVGWGPVPGKALRATEVGWGPASGKALRAIEVDWGPVSRKPMRGHGQWTACC